MTDYVTLCSQIKALTDGVPYKIANLANVAACLYMELPDVSWVGFYLEEDGALVLAPFVGKPACVRIEHGRGVCGTAFSECRTVIVPDVHAFPGHIACDSASRSEIVVPLVRDGAPVGVLDIDSESLGRFTEEDREGLERIARRIETFL